MRFVLALLLILAGVFPVLIHNNFSPSQMQTPEWIAVAVFLIIALLLIVVRRKKSDTQPEGIHSMSFLFEKLTFFLPDGSPALRQGQQLFLRPYMGEDQEQIAVTNEKAEVFGFVPEEYREYVLSRIESHSLIQTVVTEQTEEPFGAYSVKIRITC